MTRSVTVRVSAVCDDTASPAEGEGGVMQMLLVMRQLSSVLDDFLQRVTRQFRLTPQEAMVLAWLVQRPGMQAFDIATRLGRHRQSVQRSLVRLEDRMLVERYASNVRDCTAGWGLTESGRAMFEQLAHGMQLQDEMLERRGVRLRDWVNQLNDLMLATRRQPCGVPELGLVEPPSEENDVPEWDL